MRHALQRLSSMIFMALSSLMFSPLALCEDNAERYMAPPEESEFIPFAEEIKDATGVRENTELKENAGAENVDADPATSTFFSGDALASSTYADELDVQPPTYYYLGVDLGAAFLEPRIDGISYSATELSNIGFLGGFYWGPRGHIEAQYHQLGSAEVQLGAKNIKIDYSVYNFDLVFDFLQTSTAHYFFSIGATALKTDSNVPINQEKNTGIKVGVGYERFFNDQWSTRVAYQQFSGDAGLLSIGLNRHFDRISAVKKKRNNNFQ